MSFKSHSKNMIFFVFLCLLTSAPLSSAVSSDLSDTQLEAEYNFNSSLRYLGTKIGYKASPIRQAFKALSSIYSSKRDDLQTALLVAQNPSYSVKPDESSALEDRISYSEISNFVHKHYAPSASERTLPLHIRNTLAVVLGEGSSFYTRDDYFGFDSLFKEISLPKEFPKTEVMEKEEIKTQKKKLSPLPWGSIRGSEPLDKEYQEYEDRLLSSSSLGQYEATSFMKECYLRRYKSQCQKVQENFPNFFEDSEDLNKHVKKNISVYAKAWPEESIFGFLFVRKRVFKRNKSRQIKLNSCISCIDTMLKSVSLIGIESGKTKEILRIQYDITEITGSANIVDFLDLLERSNVFCPDINGFNPFRVKSNESEANDNYYHFVKKHAGKNVISEIHYFKRKV